MASHHQALPLRQALVRSCAEEGLGARAVPLVSSRFVAHRIGAGLSDTTETPQGFRTHNPVELAGSTVDEALTDALMKLPLMHKDRLLIREIGHHTSRLYAGERKDLLHVYSIMRKSSPRYVYRDHVPERVHDLYAALVCIVDAGALL
jgi:hypothetical protein